MPSGSRGSDCTVESGDQPLTERSEGMRGMCVALALEPIPGSARLRSTDSGVYLTKRTTRAPLGGTSPPPFSQKPTQTPLSAMQHGTSVGNRGYLRSLPVVPCFGPLPALLVF